MFLCVRQRPYLVMPRCDQTFFYVDHIHCGLFTIAITIINTIIEFGSTL